MTLVMHYKTTGKKNITPLGLPCKKAVYHTREEAEEMIRFIKETRVTRDIRAYMCEVCGSWHLTGRGK